MQEKRESEAGRNRRRQLQGLPLMRADVAGIDIGSERHWVCAPTADGGGREIADFGGTTGGFIPLAEWLQARGVRSVAMEARASIGFRRTKYWKPTVWKYCWWIPGSWRKCQDGTRRRIPRTANGFSDCIAADCCGVRFGLPRRSACCAPWCGTRPRWWPRVRIGCGGCKRV